MAVQTLIEMGKIYCEKSGSLYCAFIDLTKAFDKVEYNSIWNKLIKIKAGRNVCGMIWQTYKEQVKRVNWDGEFSEHFQVGRGVRQGSPLSPFLFAIVLDEVVELIRKLNEGCEIIGKKINIIVYADDIVVMGPTSYSIKRIMQVLIKELKIRGLDVNKNKTVAMEFKKGKRKRENGPLIIDGSEIKWVKEVKYLGIVLQRDFSWDGHMKVVANKMNKMGNMVLQQVGKIVEQDDRIYLLNCCAFDLYGVEFCRENNKKLLQSVARSYHWLIKRGMGLSKFYSNHAACAESELLTWELKCLWKEFIL